MLRPLFSTTSVSLGGLREQNVIGWDGGARSIEINISLSSGGWKVPEQALAQVVSRESPLPGLQIMLSACVLTWKGERCLSPSSYKAAGPTRLTGIIMTSPNLKFLIKALSPNIVTSGVRDSSSEFLTGVGHSSVHSTAHWKEERARSPVLNAGGHTQLSPWPAPKPSHQNPRARAAASKSRQSRAH